MRLSAWAFPSMREVPGASSRTAAKPGTAGTPRTQCMAGGDKGMGRPRSSFLATQQVPHQPDPQEMLSLTNRLEISQKRETCGQDL